MLAADGIWAKITRGLCNDTKAGNKKEEAELEHGRVLADYVLEGPLVMQTAVLKHGEGENAYALRWGSKQISGVDLRIVVSITDTEIHDIGSFLMKQSITESQTQCCMLSTAENVELALHKPMPQPKNKKKGDFEWHDKPYLIFRFTFVDFLQNDCDINTKPVSILNSNQSIRTNPREQSASLQLSPKYVHSLSTRQPSIRKDNTVSYRHKRKSEVNLDESVPLGSQLTVKRRRASEQPKQKTALQDLPLKTSTAQTSDPTQIPVASTSRNQIGIMLGEVHDPYSTSKSLHPFFQHPVSHPIFNPPSHEQNYPHQYSYSPLVKGIVFSPVPSLQQQLQLPQEPRSASESPRHQPSLSNSVQSSPQTQAVKQPVQISASTPLQLSVPALPTPSDTSSEASSIAEQLHRIQGVTQEEEERELKLLQRVVKLFQTRAATKKMQNDCLEKRLVNVFGTT